jgi:SPP1 family predicted phage head-tail adaptor
MLAGPLDRRIRWEVATVTTDRLGNEARAWSLAFETWCHEARLSGAETVAALETVDEQTVKLQFRWRDGEVNAGPHSRFIYEGRTYRVQAVTMIGRREGLEVIGKTRADGGEMPT